MGGFKQHEIKLLGSRDERLTKALAGLNQRHYHRTQIYRWEATVASQGKSHAGSWKALADKERLLTAAEVARVTGLSTETLAQWRSQGRGIPFIKLSRNVVRYRHGDLDDWLATRMVQVTADPPVRGT